MRLSGTKTSSIHQYRGLGDQLWDLGGQLPSLDLQFSATKNLIDSVSGQSLVSFTRASSGTYVDSQGVIRTATTNLFTRSEEFGTTWGTLNSSVSADATVAPNGISTADKIIENSTTNVHGVSRGGGSESLVNGAVYTFSVYAKAGERSFIWMQALNSFAKSYFNLSTGVVSSSGSGHTSTITATGNGWYRCAITFTSDQTNNSYRAIGMAQTSGTESYAGDGSSGLFLWGAQLEQSSTVGEYIPTTSTINSAPRFDHNPTTGESLGLLVEESRTNLCLYSQTISTSPWLPNGTETCVASTLTDPAGGTSAFKINTPGTGAFERWQQSITVVSGTTYTLSAWVRSTSGTTQFRLRFGAGVNSADFTATTAWQRFSYTLTAATTAGFFAFNAPSTGAATEIHVWGAQLEAGAFPTSYIPTTTATATRSADVASISGSNFGVSRTNLLLQSADISNVYWVKAETTVTANATTAPDGTTTAGKLIESINNSQHTLASAAISWAGNTQYTATFFAKAGERSKFDILLGTAANWVNSERVATFDLANGTVFFSPNSPAIASITPFANGWFRCRVTATTTAAPSASSVFIRMCDNAGLASYQGIANYGLYLWGAQLETGTTATAYIPTTSAAVTVVDSPWYRQDEGTVFAETQFPAGTAVNSSSRSVFDATDGSTNNRVNLRPIGGGITADQLTIRSVGSTTAQFSSNGTAVSTASRKLAAVYKVDDFASWATGATSVATDTSGAIPVGVNQVIIGGTVGATEYLSGTIRRLTYWPQRLSNSTLQSITQ